MTSKCLIVFRFLVLLNFLLPNVEMEGNMEETWKRRRSFIYNFYSPTCPEAMFSSTEVLAGLEDPGCRHVTIPMTVGGDVIKLMRDLQHGPLHLKRRKIRVETHLYTCLSSDHCQSAGGSHQNHQNEKAGKSPGRNVFLENLLSSKHLEAMYYVTDQKQTGDLLWSRDSGIRINVGLFDIQLSPVLTDVPHRGDNEYALSNPSALNDAQPMRDIIRKMCRNPLPDHYSVTLEIFKDRTTKALNVPCSQSMVNTNRCSPGGFIVRRMLNEPCPLSGSYPDVLEPAPNSVVCTSLGKSRKEWKTGDAERDLSDFPADDQQPSHTRQVSVSEIFHVEEKEDRFIRAMSKECKQASADCEMCLEKQNCSDTTDNVCCLASCHSSESCRIVSSLHCQDAKDASVECVMGDAYRMTLIPIIASPREEFSCHVTLKKPRVLFHLWFYISVVEVGFETPKEFVSLPMGSGVDQARGLEVFEGFLEVEHRVNMKVDDEYILLARNRSFKSWSYSLYPMDWREGPPSPLVSHQMSDTLFSLSTTFDRPFAYSTSSWMEGRECSKNVSKFRPVRKTRGDHGLEIKANINRVSDGSFEYQIEAAEGPAYIKLFVSGNASVLGWWFRNKTSNLIFSSLQCSLDFAADSKLWIINISGMLKSCPGLITTNILDVLESEEVAMYDMLITCPPSFNVSFIIPYPRFRNATKTFKLIISDMSKSYQVFLTYLIDEEPTEVFRLPRIGSKEGNQKPRIISKNLLEEIKFFAYQIMPACLILLCALVSQSVLFYLHKRFLTDHKVVPSDEQVCLGEGTEVQSATSNKSTSNHKFDRRLLGSDCHRETILLKGMHFKRPVARRLVVTIYSVMKLLSSIFFTATSLIFFVHSIILFRHSSDIDATKTGFHAYKEEHRMKEFVLQNYRQCAFTFDHLTSFISLNDLPPQKRRSTLLRYLELRLACHDYINNLIKLTRDSISTISNSNSDFESQLKQSPSRSSFHLGSSLQLENSNLRALKKNLSSYYKKITKAIGARLLRTSEACLASYGELLLELDSNLWTKPAWNRQPSDVNFRESIWKNFISENQSLWENHKYLVDGLKATSDIDSKSPTRQGNLKYFGSILIVEDLFHFEDKFLLIHLHRNCILSMPPAHTARRYMVSDEDNDHYEEDAFQTGQLDYVVDSLDGGGTFPQEASLAFQPLLLAFDIVLLIFRFQHLLLLLNIWSNSSNHSRDCFPSKAGHIYWHTSLIHKSRNRQINWPYWVYYKHRSRFNECYEDQLTKQESDPKASKGETNLCSKCGSELHSCGKTLPKKIAGQGQNCLSDDGKNMKELKICYEIIKAQQVDIKPPFLSKLIVASGTIILFCLAQLTLKSLEGSKQNSIKESTEQLLDRLEFSCLPTKSLYNSPINIEDFDLRSLGAYLSYPSAVKSSLHSPFLMSCAEIRPKLQSEDMDEDIYESVKGHMDSTHHEFIFQSLELVKKAMETLSHIVAALTFVSIFLYVGEQLLLQLLRSLEMNKLETVPHVLTDSHKRSPNESTVDIASSNPDDSLLSDPSQEMKNTPTKPTENHLSNTVINIPRAWQHIKKSQKASRNFYETNV